NQASEEDKKIFLRIAGKHTHRKNIHFQTGRFRWFQNGVGSYLQNSPRSVSDDQIRPPNPKTTDLGTVSFVQSFL
ncbi:MAG: hypothetical protein WC130_02825, partial [Kiritimatiellia bacterium]